MKPIWSTNTSVIVLTSCSSLVSFLRCSCSQYVISDPFRLSPLDVKFLNDLNWSLQCCNKIVFCAIFKLGVVLVGKYLYKSMNEIKVRVKFYILIIHYLLQVLVETFDIGLHQYIWENWQKIVCGCYLALFTWWE